MKLPKRIRLLKVCKDHLYNEVRQTLATDKEVRALKEMNRRISDYYVRQTGATELCSTCYTGNCICAENAKNRDKISKYYVRQTEQVNG